MKDGKPDHQHALHSRYKMELAAESEAAIRGEMPEQQQTATVSSQAAAMSAMHMANPFDVDIGGSSSAQQTDT